MKKPTRTISGVAPVAIMLPPRPCPHGFCTFCPVLKAPQSYTPESPVVLRASSVNYSAFKQVKQRIEVFEKMGHVAQKIELIIMGGTFLAYPIEFQYEFVKECYDALNGKISKTLKDAKKLNENAEHRCVALCIETRPDVCSDKDIERMLEFGATRVELGVQMPDDYLYEITRRMHSVADVILSTERLKRAGFKIGYHLMPGLPGSNLKKDLVLFKKIFSNQNFKPDQIKIYPCQVLKGAALEEDFKKGKYKPYNSEEIRALLIKMFRIVPRYCRVMRVMREIPRNYLIAGTSDLDMRKKVEEDIRDRNIKVKEIRFREVGISRQNKDEINENIKLKLSEYTASNGKEYFLEMSNEDDLLFGLLRLRIENNKSAMIRELHVYGQSAALGEIKDEKAQHKGIGKNLLEEAEKIAIKNKCESIRIISGVGVREYYRKLGYELGEREYMIKKIK